MAQATQGIWNQDWLNQNSQRKYPLSEEAGLKDTTSSFTIPNDFLVDLIWPVHADVSIDPSLFHVVGIGIYGSGVTLAIGYDGVVVGSVSIDAASFTRNQSFIVQGTGDFYDTVGKVVIGSLENVLRSAGFFSFDVANGRFEPTTIKPDIRGINSIYLQNGSDLIGPLQGDVIFQAGTNFLLNLFPGLTGEPDRIVFNAIDGAGLNQDCECDENAELPCVQTINGIAPDGVGDFTLLGDDCLSLEAIANGIQLTDECAKPCCGCEELAVVESTLSFVVDQVHSLSNLASRLEAALQVTQTNLLSSKTGTTL